MLGPEPEWGEGDARPGHSILAPSSHIRFSSQQAVLAPAARGVYWPRYEELKFCRRKRRPGWCVWCAWRPEAATHTTHTIQVAGGNYWASGTIANDSVGNERRQANDGT